MDVSFLTTSYENELKDLIVFCSKTTGSMHIPKVKLDVASDPVFLKRRIIPFGLREAVKKSLDVMRDQGVLTPVESSKLATPIVTPLKKDSKLPEYVVIMDSR